MAKMRSPNFPTIPLAQAIGLTEKIFREDRTNAIDKEVAAKHMGYTGLTGRTLKLLGALSQYGLVEKVAKGQVRVSKNAVSILHWSDEKERQEALAKAGTSPALFRRIRDTFDEPSDRTITSFLIKEGFTDVAIPSVLKSYKETNRFLAEAGVSESYGRGGDEAPESSDLEEEDDDMIEKPAADFKSQPPPPPKEETFTETLMVTFDMKSVKLSGRTTSPKELRDFIGQLTALAELFERVAPKDEFEELIG